MVVVKNYDGYMNLKHSVSWAILVIVMVTGVWLIFSIDHVSDRYIVL